MTEHCKHDLTDNCHLCRESDESRAADWATTGHGRGPDGREIELGHVVGVRAIPAGQSQVQAEEVAGVTRRAVAAAWEMAKTRENMEGALVSYHLALTGAIYSAEKRCQIWRDALHAKERILIDARIQGLEAVIAKIAGLLHRGWITEAIDVIDGLGPNATETTEAEKRVLAEQEEK